MASVASAGVGARPRARHRPGWILPLAGIAVVLALLEAATLSGAVDRRYFPLVTDMLARLGSLLDEGDFWTAVAHTMQGWAIGLGIATVLAVPLGVLIGSSRMLHRAVRAVIEFLRPIPSVALIPLAVLVYGTGLESKVFLVTFASFWPLLVQTLYGVQDVDPVAQDTARSFGFSRRQRLVRVTLPGSLPYVATGLRIASATALILAVTAELVIGSPGLGRSINVARSGGAVELMYALIIATGLLGWALNIVFAAGERRLLHWHPSHREVAS